MKIIFPNCCGGEKLRPEDPVPRIFTQEGRKEFYNSLTGDKHADCVNKAIEWKKSEEKAVNYCKDLIKEHEM